MVKSSTRPKSIWAGIKFFFAAALMLIVSCMAIFAGHAGDPLESLEIKKKRRRSGSGNAASHAGSFGLNDIPLWLWILIIAALILLTVAMGFIAAGMDK